MPPNPPFDMTRTWSPARASAATSLTSASTLSRQRTRLPSVAKTAAASQPSPAFTHRRRRPGRRLGARFLHHAAHSIGARLEARQECTPCDAPPTSLQGVQSRGWCAKSSYTVMPPARPRTSMRRSTKAKAPKLARLCAVTPTVEPQRARPGVEAVVSPRADSAPPEETFQQRAPRPPPSASAAHACHPGAGEASTVVQISR